MGTPNDIYENPVSVFVADFIGSTNIIKGVATNCDSIRGVCTVRLSSSSALPIPFRETVKVGEEVSFIIKPEKIELRKKRHLDTDIEGKISGASYLGSAFNYEVDLGNLRLEVLDSQADYKKRYEIGDPVLIASEPGRDQGPPEMNMGFKKYLRKHLYLLLLAPPLMVLTVFLLIPLAILLQYSFSTHIPGQASKIGFTLVNYVRFMTDPYYLNGLLITLLTGLVVVTITLLFAYPVAYLYAKTRFKYRGILLIMLLSPFYTNIIIKIFGWMVILGRQGMVNKLLVQYQLLDRPFEFLYSYIGVIIIMVYVHVPMMTLLLIGPIQNIKDSLIESARICGSTNLGCDQEHYPASQHPGHSFRIDHRLHARSLRPSSSLSSWEETGERGSSPS